MLLLTSEPDTFGFAARFFAISLIVFLTSQTYYLKLYSETGNNAKHNRYRRKHRNNFFLAPAAHFKMMMNRTHFKNPFSCQLK